MGTTLRNRTTTTMTETKSRILLLDKIFILIGIFLGIILTDIIALSSRYLTNEEGEEEEEEKEEEEEEVVEEEDEEDEEDEEEGGWYNQRDWTSESHRYFPSIRRYKENHFYLIFVKCKLTLKNFHYIQNHGWIFEDDGEPTIFSMVGLRNHIPAKQEIIDLLGTPTAYQVYFLHKFIHNLNVTIQYDRIKNLKRGRNIYRVDAISMQLFVQLVVRQGKPVRDAMDRCNLMVRDISTRYDIALCKGHHDRHDARFRLSTRGERSSTNQKDVRQALQTNSERNSVCIISVNYNHKSDHIIDSEEAVSRSGGTVFMVMNLLANNGLSLTRDYDDEEKVSLKKTEKEYHPVDVLFSTSL
ncbi:heat shock protein isoform X1 [Vespula squamosa]|uniref:Heat shock protein isoform X1 n=1 Tax=Vespula squamosa TaxID=30214 RepID=A0ABD2AEB9_VESSQ